MSVDIVDKFVGIFAHLEEICFFLGRLNFSAAVGALSVLKLGVCPERFEGSTVLAFVGSLVDIALIVKALEDFLYLLLVVFVGGADELIVRTV